MALFLSYLLPYTWISASPIAHPTAPVTVNCTHVIVLPENVVVRAAPLFGNCPTAILEPSLNDKVPAVMFSIVFGRSYSTTLEILTALLQDSLIHAPAS